VKKYKFQQHVCVCKYFCDCEQSDAYFSIMAKHTKDRSDFFFIMPNSVSLFRHKSVCASSCKSLILICRIYELFCGFVNCVKYFDKTRLVCKIVC